MLHGFSVLRKLSTDWSRRYI